MAMPEVEPLQRDWQTKPHCAGKHYPSSPRPFSCRKLMYNESTRREARKHFSAMLKKFVLYAFRWQLSTPILAPVLIYCDRLFNDDPNINFWIATVVANFIGSCIFFWVDRFIFRTKIKNPLWEVKDETPCSVCGKTSRCYRLFRAKNYDRTDDKNPIFLCEECSRKKVEELKERGVEIP